MRGRCVLVERDDEHAKGVKLRRVRVSAGLGQGPLDGVGAFVAVDVDEEPEEHAEADLEQELFPGFEAVAAGAALACEHLEQVVGEAEQAEPDKAEDAHEDVEVGEIAQEKRRDKDGDEDEDSAHRGGVGVVARHLVEELVVEVGVVAHLEADKRADHGRAEPPDDEKLSRMAQAARKSTLWCA